MPPASKDAPPRKLLISVVRADASTVCPPYDPTTPYGGYDLRRGDRDSNLTYAGSVRSSSSGEIVPVSGSTPFVQQLQQDLTTLAYSLVSHSNPGEFDRFTEWAVREFQIYSKMSKIAKESTSTATSLVDRLSAVANPSRYTGPISGVVNSQTRDQLVSWLGNGFRCPVIISAFNMAGNVRRSLQTENIWLHDEVADTSPRMFARDFSNYYNVKQFDPSRNPDDLVVVGDFTRFPPRFNGPECTPPPDPRGRTWAEAEILPEHLIGTSLASLSGQQRSTFKVVRAISENEPLGFFDGMNAFDNAFLSLGPYHWTLGIVDPAVPPRVGVTDGELCAYLAFLRRFENPGFVQALENFGIRPTKDWGTDGKALFESSSKKYACRIALQQETGDFKDFYSVFPVVATREDEMNYFKSWHWFYRFVMAARTIPAFRLRMWDMARIRVRDILTSPMNVDDGAGGRRSLGTVHDVFTSECATALLVRMHPFVPAEVINRGQAGRYLQRAFGRARVPNTAGPPSSWTDGIENDLINGLFEEARTAHAIIGPSMQNILDWPSDTVFRVRGYRLDKTIGALDRKRNSFAFDNSGLPPAP